jgi:hypothetical protein
MDNYQGLEVDVLFIDEATMFEEKVYKMFKACVRGVNNFPKRIYLTCNPGGKGHAWVKRLFIDKRYEDDEDPEEYEFIQALLQDNKALMEADPDYIKQLEGLPPKLRKAWLLGLWDVFEGQYFEEFVDDPKNYDTQTWTHVIRAFNIPQDWIIYRSFDFGYNKPFSVGWWAISPDNTMYRILEYYGCVDKAPNEGIKLIPEEIYAQMQKIEQEHPWLKGRKILGVADPSIWDASRGISIAATGAKYSIFFEPGDNARIPGWMQVHYRLAFDENGRPMMYVFENCKAFIRTMPTLVYDKNKVEDIDTNDEDHVADEVRYLCMRNPIAPRKIIRKSVPLFDPLDLNEDNNNDKFTFFRNI